MWLTVQSTCLCMFTCVEILSKLEWQLHVLVETAALTQTLAFKQLDSMRMAKKPNGEIEKCDDKSAHMAWASTLGKYRAVVFKGAPSPKC